MRAPYTAERNRKVALAKIAEKNPQWKGDEVGYAGVHSWIKSRLQKPKLCQGCKKDKPYDLANVSGKYLRQLDDWQWLCRKCHMNSDGRIKNLAQYLSPETRTGLLKKQWANFSKEERRKRILKSWNTRRENGFVFKPRPRDEFGRFLKK